MFHHTRWDGTPYPVEDCPLVNVRATGKPVRVDEDTFWRKDGKRLPVAYSSTPVDGPDGTGCVVAFRDITPLQDERDRLRAQARHAVWFEQVRLALLAASGRVVTANLSAESVGRVEMLLHIERELARTGALPGNFVVELTETALMHDLQEGRRFADRLATTTGSWSRAWSASLRVSAR